MQGKKQQPEGVKSRRENLMNKMRLQIQGKTAAKEKAQRLNEKLERLRAPIESGNRQKSERGESSNYTSQLECYQGVFEEKYTLQEKIGEGGNGFVYKCINNNNQKVYAVKMMRMDEEKKRQLKTNFIFMKELRDDSILNYKALYFNQQKRLAYLVTEYFPSDSLEELGTINEEELKEITTKILKAIKYIHQRNICHRDIKPDNILYNRATKEIKLIDFGISKKTFRRGVRSDMITVTGTFLYLAPQVFNGGGYNEQIDLWGLGVTLYKLVTKKTPFESQYLGDTINNIKAGEVSFKQLVWSKYSFFVKDFISRLIKSADKRMNVHTALEHLWFINLKTSKGVVKNQKNKVYGEIKNQKNNLYILSKNSKINTLNFELPKIYQDQKLRGKSFGEENQEQCSYAFMSSNIGMHSKVNEDRIQKSNANAHSEHSDENANLDEIKNLPKVINYPSKKQFDLLDGSQEFIPIPIGLKKVKSKVDVSNTPPVSSFLSNIKTFD